MSWIRISVYLLLLFFDINHFYNAIIYAIYPSNTYSSPARFLPFSTLLRSPLLLAPPALS